MSCWRKFSTELYLGIESMNNFSNNVTLIQLFGSLGLSSSTYMPKLDKNNWKRKKSSREKYKNQEI